MNLEDDGAGKKKSKREPKMESEAAFLRNRRDSIDRLMSEKRPMVKQTSPKLSKEASKEVAFQEKKRFAKMVEAYDQGILAKKFISKSFLKKVVQFQKKKKQNESNRTKQESKVKKAVQHKQELGVRQVRELQVHVDTALKDDPQVCQWLRACGIKAAPERVKAHVFLVVDPSTCSQRTKLVALLKGGYLATPQSCRDGAMKGPLMFFV